MAKVDLKPCIHVWRDKVEDFLREGIKRANEDPTKTVTVSLDLLRELLRTMPTNDREWVE
jgi:hypothetical protein